MCTSLLLRCEFSMCTAFDQLFCNTHTLPGREMRCMCYQHIHHRTARLVSKFLGTDDSWYLLLSKDASVGERVPLPTRQLPLIFSYKLYIKINKKTKTFSTLYLCSLHSIYNLIRYQPCC